jgi:hypothetical protein
MALSRSLTDEVIGKPFGDDAVRGYIEAFGLDDA